MEASVDRWGPEPVQEGCIFKAVKRYAQALDQLTSPINQLVTSYSQDMTTLHLPFKP